jgi:hypothetical protein
LDSRIHISSAGTNEWPLSRTAPENSTQLKDE